MSRVAKKPIQLAKGVELLRDGSSLTIKGPKGSLSTAAPAGVSVAAENGVIAISADSSDRIAMAGTLRALLANMVQGVSEGYARKLELVGVGYRASVAGRDLNLSLGFSHPVVFNAPDGITLETPSQTEILVKGSDKQMVGQVAAKIRAFRPPEPYKGKGVRYTGEKIIMKEAKKA